MALVVLCHEIVCLKGRLTTFRSRYCGFDLVVVFICITYDCFNMRPFDFDRDCRICSVEILRGSGSADGDGGYIEVRPGGVNKGAFVSGILSRQVRW